MEFSTTQIWAWQKFVSFVKQIWGIEEDEFGDCIFAILIIRL